MKLKESLASVKTRLLSLSKEIKTAINTYWLAVFLVASMPNIWNASEFWQQVLKQSVRLWHWYKYAEDKFWQWKLVKYECNISNIAVNWIIHQLTTEHCSKDFDWRFYNSDLKIWEVISSNWYLPLQYDQTLTDEDVIWKTIQVIWKVPFPIGKKTYTLDVEFEIEVLWKTWNWQLVWVLNLGKFYDKINTYLNNRYWYEIISWDKKSIMSWLSWSPMFYWTNVFWVYSNVLWEKDSKNLADRESLIRQIKAWKIRYSDLDTLTLKFLDPNKMIVCFSWPTVFWKTIQRIKAYQ